MKLRILIPTLGDSPWLSEALQSARGVAGAEVVLISPRVDWPKGGSVRWAQDPGRGLYAALNVGLRAGGEWDAFTWINDDDRLRPEFTAAVDALAHAGIGYGRVGVVDTAGARMGELPVARHGRDVRALLARGIMPLAQPGTAMRRDVIDRLGGLDETYRLAGDLDLFVRAVASGVTFTFVNTTVAEFRLRAGQLSKQEAVAETEKERALAPLRGTSGRGTAALLRFRWANRSVYLERIRRHGFVSMRTLYRHG
jgi:hypothetical protein